jgi:hypothetical protein
MTTRDRQVKDYDLEQDVRRKTVNAIQSAKTRFTADIQNELTQDEIRFLTMQISRFISGVRAFFQKHNRQE